MAEMKLTFEQLPIEVARQGEILDRIIDLLRTSNQKPILQDSNSDKLLVFGEACQYLNLSKPTLYRKVSNREIPHIKRGRKLYFYVSELNSYLKKGKRKSLDEIQEEASQFKEKRR
ncbi:helix-turn-helix domain-containing protein [Sphingobacterium humi]|nr:helix-turn-helix domain-containing protein [Sphingobacterium humi]